MNSRARASFNPIAAGKAWLKQRMQQWLDRKSPAKSSVLLHQGNVFIFPSAAGLGYLILSVLLWLVATNYENNLVFMLACLLISLFIVSILHTFGNLSGIKISAIKSEPAFAGEDACIYLVLEKSIASRRHENILFSWPEVAPSIVNLTDHEQEAFKLYVPALKRGRFDPGRLLIKTYYPLGLLKAWTWVDLNIRLLVYPKPLDCGPMPAATRSGDGAEEVHNQGSEEFYGLHDYQAGESLKHVAWKHYARSRKMYTKEYSAYADRQLWIDWDYLSGRSREERLSGLCHWVLEVAKGREDYGLRLPGLEIPPARGDAHKAKVLEALALFPDFKKTLG